MNKLKFILLFFIFSAKLVAIEPTTNILTKKYLFYVKAGVALNNFIYSELRTPVNPSFQVSEALDLGYSIRIRNKFYWSPEIGLTTKGGRGLEEIFLSSIDDVDYFYTNYLYHGIKVTPINFSFRTGMTKDLAIEPHIGLFGCYYFSGRLKTNMAYDFTIDDLPLPDIEANYSNGLFEFNKQTRFDLGFSSGFSLWYRRYCFDFAYNMGFVSKFPSPEMFNYNLQFKVGVAI